jgi:hypothetical protein
MKSLFNLVLFLLVSTSVFSQSYYRALTEEALKLQFENSNDFSYRFSSRINSLNWEIDLKIEPTYNQYKKLFPAYDVEKSAKELIYNGISYTSKTKLYETIIKDCNYTSIDFKITLITADYKKITFLYSVDIEQLITIRPSFEESDLFKILYKPI